MTWKNDPRPFAERCREANGRADIVAVALRLGLDVSTRSKVPSALCPFHGDEGRPNLCFYQDPYDGGSRGWKLPRCHCYSCGITATAIDLVQHELKCTIFEALEWVQDFCGIRGGELPPAQPARAPSIPLSAPPRRNLRGAVNQSIRRLWNAEGRDARRYLEARGVLEVAQQYQLGYWGIDESSWSGRFTIPYLESLEPDSEVWAQLGGRIRLAEYAPGFSRSRAHPQVHDVRRAGTHRVQPQPSDHAGRSNADDSPKYRYSSAAVREPYLWEIGKARAARAGYLIVPEGELDGLSILSAYSDPVPVVARGGIGADAAFSNCADLKGIGVLLIADLEAEGVSTQKSDAARRVIAGTVWKLKQSGADVRVLYPPSVKGGDKVDVNDLLMIYGADGVQDWLRPEIETLLAGRDS